MSPKNPNMAQAGFYAGFIDMLPLTIGTVPFGLIVGALGNQVGLETWELVFMSAAVFAGAAQLIALEMWSSPLPALAIVGTTLMVNLRHVLMSAAVAPHVRNIPRWARYAYLYVMADEPWAITMRRVTTDGSVAWAYLLGTVAPFYLSWVMFSYIGTQLGSFIDDPATWGFDFVFTAVFLTLILGFWRHDRRGGPIVASAAASLLAWGFWPGTWYIFAGSMAGFAAAFLTFRPTHAPDLAPDLAPDQAPDLAPDPAIPGQEEKGREGGET